MPNKEPRRTDNRPDSPDIPGYEFLERLRANGRSDVWKATPTAKGVGLVAIKIARDSQAATVASFARQISTASAVSHANVLRIYDLGVNVGLPFLVCEYMPGSLANLMAENEKLPAEDAAIIAIQAAEGLAALHRSGMAHGDVKPSNLLVDPETLSLKIADFGSVSPLSVTLELTDGIDLTGTPRYASPEQARGATASAASDIYSLGLVILEMLTGEESLEGLSTAQALEQRKTGDEISLDQAPSEWRKLLRKCLAFNPSERYSDAAQLASDLRGMRTGGEQRDRTVTLHPTEIEPPEKLVVAHQALSRSAALAEAERWVLNDAAIAMQTATIRGRWNHEGEPAAIVEVEREIAGQRHVDSLNMTIDSLLNARIDSVNSHIEKLSVPRFTGKRLAIVGTLTIAALVTAALAFSFIRQDSDIPRSPALLSVRESKEIEVFADRGWQDSGIEVQALETISITASGDAFYAGCCTARPDGVANREGVSHVALDHVRRSTWLAQYLTAHALIGKIGESEPFFIGSSFDFTSDRSGVLYLAMNDLSDTYYDNDGAWTVDVQVGEGNGSAEMKAIPQLYLFTDPEDGMLQVMTGDTKDGESYVLFRAGDSESDPSTIVGKDLVEIAPLPPGDSACFFVRTVTGDSYGPASRTSCATGPSAGSLAVDSVFTIDTGGLAASFAASLDGERLLIGGGQNVYEIDILTYEVVRQVQIDLPVGARIIDVATNPIDGNLIYVAGTRQASIIGFLDSELRHSNRISDLAPDFHELDIADDVPGEVYAFDGKGWIVFSTVTGEILRSVTLDGQKTSEGQLSADGQIVLSQKGDSAEEDTLFAFDATTGEELGSFTFGDKGGGVHFVDGESDGQAMLFVGDGSISQNAYVLGLPRLNLLQELQIEGLAWGAEIGNSRMVVGQNWSLAGPDHSTGITLVSLTQLESGMWDVHRELELEAGRGSYPGKIICVDDTENCFVHSARTGNVYVFGAS